MALKLKKVTEKNTVKNNEGEVKLNLMSITSKKTLQQLAQYELAVMINRLKFLAEEHNLVPVIRNIEITFETIHGGEQCHNLSEFGTQQATETKQDP